MNDLIDLFDLAKQMKTHYSAEAEALEAAVEAFVLHNATNAEGWALIDAPIAEGYKAHILSLPAGYEGYTFSGEDTYLASGQTELTLVATKPAA
jgi:hypothetical protein